MKKYVVEIVVKTIHKVEVISASPEGAENTARRLYDSGALEGEGELDSVTFDTEERRASIMKKQKVFVLIKHGADNQDYSGVNVIGVYSTKTAAKERMEEEEDNILDFYKEEYPDNYEVSEDKDESSWSCSCKDSIMFDELLITESELD